MPRDTLILCYHAVSRSWPADLSLPPSDFERQLRRLLRRGYWGTTLSGSQAADRPARALVVTFDDGYLSTLTMAAPILERLGIPATLFVPTDYIGRPGPMSWPGIERWSASPHRGELEPLSWDQVRSLAEKDWQIGSHTCSHPRLTQLGDEELEHELHSSREALTRELGGPCETIAYPYGDVDERVAGAARAAGYEIGVGLPARWMDLNDRMQLPRVGVYNGQGRAKVALKTSALVRRLRRTSGR